MAAAKAIDAVYHVDPPPAAKKLRELLYSAFYVTDHTTISMHSQVLILSSVLMHLFPKEIFWVLSVKLVSK
jgi:coenzyme F420-reducing hydrogenase alpha subunit